MSRLARAIVARIAGVFDDPDLLSFGPLTPSVLEDVERFARDVLERVPPVTVWAITTEIPGQPVATSHYASKAEAEDWAGIWRANWPEGSATVAPYPDPTP